MVTAPINAVATLQLTLQLHMMISRWIRLFGGNTSGLLSGHVYGLQQSPAMGRATAEMLVHGEYRSLDLSLFSYSRIENNTPIIEKAVI
jgi:hypothetical protein